MHSRYVFCIHRTRRIPLPDYPPEEILLSVHFVQYASEPVGFVVVQVNPDRTVRSQKVLDLLKPVTDHGQPDGVVEVVVVVVEGGFGVEGRIDITHPDLPDQLGGDVLEVGE